MAKVTETKKKKSELDKFTKEKKITVFDFVPIVIAIVLVVFIKLVFFTKDTTPFGYAELPSEVESYLLKSNYSKAYTSGKLMVVSYSTRDKENTYPKLFEENLKIAKRNLKITENYEFKMFNVLTNEFGDSNYIKNEKLLRKTCRSFCVINPAKKQLYFWYLPTVSDGENLIDNLESLIHWGIKLKH